MKQLKHLEHQGGDLPQPTLSEAHNLLGFSLQAALRLRLRLHGVNHNTPSPMARWRVKHLKHLKHLKHHGTR